MTRLTQLACRLLCLGLLLTVLHPAYAELVSDIYVAEVPVKGQGTEARTEAIREAFMQVMIKVTGNREVGKQSAARKLLSRAPRYVQQYRYSLLKQTRDAAGRGVASADRLLWVKFDERAVNNLLRESGLAVWGGARPSTLIWIGLEEQGRRRLIQPELEPTLSQTLEQVAGQRGLPILLPLMDMEDRSSLQVSDVWGAFEEDVRRASDRYLPDAILVGRLRKRAARDWVADWTLYQSDVTNNWQTRGANETAVAGDGLQRTVDELAARYAPHAVTQGASNLRVRVVGLHNLADYILVKDYLQSLVMIEQLDLLTADPDRISFLVRSQGRRDVLERGILLGGVLEPVVAADAVVSAEATPADQFDAESLEFRLR